MYYIYKNNMKIGNIEKKYCVYRHRRLDTNEIFYIGIGNIKRPYSKEIRNNLWEKIIKKSDYSIEIIAEDLNKELAIELEIFLIKQYGRKDLKTGCLSNLTDGGEGLANYIMTEETKLKSGIYNKGIKSRRRKDVYQYDLNNNLIKKWECIKIAESFYNKNPKSKNIVACCNNRQCTAYGYIWKHSPKNKYKIKIENPKTNNIKVIDLENNLQFESIMSLSKYLKINYSTLKGRFKNGKYGRFKKM